MYPHTDIGTPCGNTAGGTGEYALTLLACDDLPAYRRFCADLVRRYGQTEDPALAARVARICQLAPRSVEDLSQPVRLAELAVKKDPKNSDRRRTLGVYLLRAGRHEEAIKQFQQALNDRGKDDAIQDWLYLALANAEAGKLPEAQKWIDQAQSEFERTGKPPSASAATWQSRLEWQIVRQEVQTAVKARGEGK